jgi:mannopine transport system ATP-binding protein
VRVAIRPEDIAIEPHVKGSFSDDGGLHGSVETVIFLGQAHLILVKVDGQEAPIQVLVPAGARQLSLTQGDAVFLSVTPSAVRLFPDRARAVQ